MTDPVPAKNAVIPDYVDRCFVPEYISEAIEEDKDNKERGAKSVREKKERIPRGTIRYCNPVSN